VDLAPPAAAAPRAPLGRRPRPGLAPWPLGRHSSSSIVFLRSSSARRGMRTEAAAQAVLTARVVEVVQECSAGRGVVEGGGEDGGGGGGIAWACPPLVRGRHRAVASLGLASHGFGATAGRESTLGRWHRWVARQGGQRRVLQAEGGAAMRLAMGGGRRGGAGGEASGFATIRDGSDHNKAGG